MFVSKYEEPRPKMLWHGLAPVTSSRSKKYAGQTISDKIQKAQL